VAELADALDLGSSGITVGVQLPSLAPFFLAMIPLNSALFLADRPSDLRMKQTFLYRSRDGGEPRGFAKAREPLRSPWPEDSEAPRKEKA
jgi:hypothetical protein